MIIFARRPMTPEEKAYWKNLPIKLRRRIGRAQACKDYAIKLAKEQHAALVQRLAQLEAKMVEIESTDEATLDVEKQRALRTSRLVLSAKIADTKIEIDNAAARVQRRICDIPPAIQTERAR